MGRYSAHVDIGFSIDLEVSADTPELALGKAREILSEAKGGDALSELVSTSERNDWDVRLRGVYDHKSMLNQ